MEPRTGLPTEEVWKRNQRKSSGQKCISKNWNIQGRGSPRLLNKMGVCISEGPKCQQAWIDQGKLSSRAEAEAELCLSGQESDGEGFGSRNWAGSDLDLRKSVFFYRIQHRWVEGR